MKISLHANIKKEIKRKGGVCFIFKFKHLEVFIWNWYSLTISTQTIRLLKSQDIYTL